MAISKISIFKIRSTMRKELSEAGLCGKTIDSYMSYLNHLIKFMEDQSLDSYTGDVGELFFHMTRNNSTLTGTGRANLHKVVRVLDYVIGLEKSPIMRYRTREKYVYPEIYQPVMAKFIEVFREIGRSEGTLARYEYDLSRFTVGMWLKKIGPNSITRDSITEFLSERPNNSIHSLVTSIKYFCRFLYEQGILDDDFENFFKRFRSHVTQKVLSYYTPSEILQIEQSIDRTKEMGKRNYAMVLLATRLGLRSSDIRNLKFEDIDWDLNRIRIVQLKTHNELELPLLGDVGEALVDYIKNSRPQSKFTRIFVSHQYPYEAITSENFYRVVQTCILNANVYDDDRKHGPHCMRHSLATTLLNNGEPLNVISDILGHKSTESTTRYLTVDIKSLIQCSLDVPTINESFYKQCGGIFYDRIYL